MVWFIFFVYFFQKRAQALQSKRVQADAAVAAAREKELARERRLLARPAPSLQARLEGAGSPA